MNFYEEGADITRKDAIPANGSGWWFDEPKLLAAWKGGAEWCTAL